MDVSFPHTPRRKNGHACPQPNVSLNVLTESRSVIDFEFVYDTGSEFSLIPADKARLWRIPYRAEAALRKNGIGLKGERCDAFFDIVRCSLLDVWFDLPTFFYFPSEHFESVKPVAPSIPLRASPLPPQPGPDASVEEWEALVEEYSAALLSESVDDGPTKSLFDDPPFILGRAGFIDQFRVTVHATRVTVATL